MIHLFKHFKLIAVLLFIVAVLVLGLLVGSLTSCSPETQQIQRLSAPTAPATVQTPTPVWLIEDGTLYHPYYLDPPPGITVERWDVLTVHGHERWTIAWLSNENDDPIYAKAGQYISYQNNEYQVSSINVAHKTMAAMVLGN